MAYVGKGRRGLGLALAGLSAMAAAGGALACCPKDGNGAPKAIAKSGLGDAQPAALNVAEDPAWRVYRFAKDGIDYVQVNDVRGAVRAAVGRAGDVAWVMPMGRDVDRVQIVSSQPASGKLMFRSVDVAIFVAQTSNGDQWYVQPLANAPQ